MTSPWQPYREPLRTSLLRTISIAVVVGGVLAASSRELARWPKATLLVLWFSLGGHCVEVFFLNWLRPRLDTARPIQVAARIVVWFVGGAGLAIGMSLTAMALGFPPAHWGTWTTAMAHVWWLGGLGFIAVELVAHLVMHLRGRPSFYDGRG